MKNPSIKRSDLPVYLALGVGLTLGAVALPFVQVDHPSLPRSVAVQISLGGGLLLSATALLFLGLLDWVRPPATRRPRPVDGEFPAAADDLAAAAAA